MSQARRDERKRLREAREIGVSLGRDFMRLVKILGTKAPEGHPPELFGMMEAMSEVFAFFPAFVASNTEGGEESPETRILSVDVVDKAWQSVKSEMLDGLEGEPRYALTQRVLAWECARHDHLSTKNPCPTCKRAAEIVGKIQ